MKVREGFVSNSSSTSFIVAIPGEISERDRPYITLFEKIVQELKAKDSDFGYSFVEPKDFIKEYDQKIQEAQDEKKMCEHYYNQIAEFMGNKTQRAAVQLYLDIVEKSRGVEHLKYHTPKKHMSELQNETQDYIKDIDKKIKKLEEEREQILNAKDAKYIMTFTLDHWTHDLGIILKTMIEHGIVKLVRRVDS